MNTFILIMLIISACINIFLTIAIYKSLARIELLETWIIEFKNNIKSLYKNLKFIDDRDIFEKDDDVGILFDEISSIISAVSSKVIDEDNNT